MWKEEDENNENRRETDQKRNLLPRTVKLNLSYETDRVQQQINNSRYP